MNSHLLRTILIGVLSCGGAPLWAGAGFRMVDQDAAATGRGQAFTATADNPSAIYYNPAAITRLKGVQLRGGVYGVGLRAGVKMDGATNENLHEFVPAPQVYATWTPEHGPVSFGLGVYSPYGLATKFRDRTPFRTTAKDAQIRTVTVNPVVAVQVTRQLSLGVGATINRTDAELTRGIVQPGDEFKVQGAGMAYGFNAGLLWQPTEQHSLGVRYHSGTEPTLSGHTSVKTKDLAVPTPLGVLSIPGFSTEEDMHTDLHLPQFVTVGYSFRPTPEWNIEVDADWTDWNSLNDLTIYRGKAETVRVPLHWRSNWFYSAGVTRSWSSGWRASVGYIYAEKMVSAETFTAALPDNDRHVFTAGLGYHGERWTLDVAYEYSHQPSRRIDLDAPTDGTYRLDTHAVAVSAGVAF